MDAVGLVGNASRNLFSLWKPTGNRDSKFDFAGNGPPRHLLQFGENLAAQGEQLALPYGVFHFHNQPRSNHTDRLRMRRNLLTYRIGPSGYDELFI